MRECKSLPSLPYIFLLTIINISLGIWRVGWQRKRIIQNSFRSSRWRLVDHSSGVWNAFFRILSCVAMSGMETGDWRGEEQSPAWSQLSVALHHIIPSPSHLSLSPRSIISVLWGPGYSTDLIGSSITINTHLSNSAHFEACCAWFNQLILIHFPIQPKFICYNGLYRRKFLSF